MSIGYTNTTNTPTRPIYSLGCIKLNNSGAVEKSGKEEKKKRKKKNQTTNKTPIMLGRGRGVGTDLRKTKKKQTPQKNLKARGGGSSGPACDTKALDIIFFYTLEKNKEAQWRICKKR